MKSDDMKQSSFTKMREPASKIPAGVRRAITWLIIEWNKVDGLPKIYGKKTKTAIWENKWIQLAVESYSAADLKKVLHRYAEVRTDPQGRFFNGYKKWGLYELFSRQKGAYVDHLLEEDWEKVFERHGKKEREIPIGRSQYGGYTPKKGLAE